MLKLLRERLVPTDALERHMLTARLLGMPASVVDVGGGSGDLARYLNGAAVTAVNVEGADVIVEPGPHALPFGDRQFETSVSIDTLEHIPPGDRALFVREVLRVADRRTVLCCPLGSPTRTAVEQAYNAWYRDLTGVDHPWVAEHLEHGAPTLHELEALFASDDHRIEVHFNGDLRATARQFRMAEVSQMTRRPLSVARWVAFRLTHPPDLSFDPRPSAATNRVFVVAERRG
jgi:hypothetical protein